MKLYTKKNFFFFSKKLIQTVFSTRKSNGHWKLLSEWNLDSIREKKGESRLYSPDGAHGKLLVAFFFSKYMSIKGN